ncbi:hypothetical protein ES704_01361 [subsurface metagenome]|jgi:hypothetical protein
MVIMNVKKAIILLLMIGIMVIISGCARWPYEPGPEPETDYQLEITVEVAGTINSYDGIYYIVLDADGNSATGPGYDISFWDDRFYYIKLEDGFFYFAQKEEGSSEISLTSSSIGENKFQVTIALSDLGVPSDIDFSIDINVITTDSENNTYDHLDSYFTISTIINSTGEGIVSGDGTGGENFDIVKIEALITTLY